jgi:hypothetical protein
MPFELGMDLGCRYFGTSNNKEYDTHYDWNEKKCLVFERNKNDYDSFISDLSGQDIKSHENDPKKLVRRLQEWLDLILPESRIPSPSAILRKYEECENSVVIELSTQLEYSREEYDSLPINNFMKAISEWISENNFTRN